MGKHYHPYPRCDLANVEKKTHVVEIKMSSAYFFYEIPRWSAGSYLKLSSALVETPKLTDDDNDDALKA